MVCHQEEIALASTVLLNFGNWLLHQDQSKFGYKWKTFNCIYDRNIMRSRLFCCIMSVLWSCVAISRLQSVNVVSYFLTIYVHGRVILKKLQSVVPCLANNKTILIERTDSRLSVFLFKLRSTCQDLNIFFRIRGGLKIWQWTMSEVLPLLL